MTPDAARNLDDDRSPEALEEGDWAETLHDLTEQVERLRDSGAAQRAAVEKSAPAAGPAVSRVLRGVVRAMKRDEEALRDIEAALDLLWFELEE
jgi:uncharacterized protein (UPF0335 family)